MASKQKGAGKQQTLTSQEVQQTFNRLKNELQALAQKIGELESEADEHELVLGTLNGLLTTDPKRKCFRLIGGVLVERTVEDVVPSLQTNRDGIRKVVESLVGQYKTKESELGTLTQDYNIRVRA